MNEYFDYCDKIKIKVLLSKIDSMLIRRTDLDKARRFIWEKLEYLKREGEKSKKR
jgi:hypothetical protein